jgi:hypothetical protein
LSEEVVEGQDPDVGVGKFVAHRDRCAISTMTMRKEKKRVQRASCSTPKYGEAVRSRFLWGK